MSCSNKALSEKLTDYFTGHLEESENRAIEAHLADCGDCCKSLKVMHLLANDASPGTGSSGEHIDRDLLAKYYENKASLGAQQIEKVRQHLKQCRECSYEYQFLRDMEQELQQSIEAELSQPSLVDRILSFSWTLARKPAFAYFLLLLTLYPATRYVTEPKGGTQDSGSLFPETVYQLVDMTRAGGEYPRVIRTTNNNLVRVSLPVYHATDDFDYQIRLENEDRDRDFGIEKLSNFSRKGSIELVINTDELNDGPFVLCVYEVERMNPFDTTVWTYPIELQTVYRPDW